MHVFQCRHVVSCCGVRINCHRLLQWWRVIGSYGLQHHWAVRICHPRDWSDHSAADGRQHQEHNVLWAAVRGPRARSLSRCLPRASGRRTGSRRTALLETLVSLPVTGDDGQVDEAAAWEDGLDVTNERRSSCFWWTVRELLSVYVVLLTRQSTSCPQNLIVFHYLMSLYLFIFSSDVGLFIAIERWTANTEDAPRRCWSEPNNNVIKITQFHSLALHVGNHFMTRNFTF